MMVKEESIVLEFTKEELSPGFPAGEMAAQKKQVMDEMMKERIREVFRAFAKAHPECVDQKLVSARKKKEMRRKFNGET